MKLWFILILFLFKPTSLEILKTPLYKVYVHKGIISDQLENEMVIFGDYLIAFCQKTSNADSNANLSIHQIRNYVDTSTSTRVRISAGSDPKHPPAQQEREKNFENGMTTPRDLKQTAVKSAAARNIPLLKLNLNQIPQGDSININSARGSQATPRNKILTPRRERYHNLKESFPTSPRNTSINLSNSNPVLSNQINQLKELDQYSQSKRTNQAFQEYFPLHGKPNKPKLQMNTKKADSPSQQKQPVRSNKDGLSQSGSSDEPKAHAGHPNHSDSLDGSTLSSQLNQSKVTSTDEMKIFSCEYKKYPQTTSIILYQVDNINTLIKIFINEAEGKIIFQTKTESHLDLAFDYFRLMNQRHITIFGRLTTYDVKNSFKSSQINANSLIFKNTDNVSNFGFSSKMVLSTTKYMYLYINIPFTTEESLELCNKAFPLAECFYIEYKATFLKDNKEEAKAYVRYYILDNGKFEPGKNNSMTYNLNKKNLLEISGIDVEEMKRINNVFHPQNTNADTGDTDDVDDLLEVLSQTRSEKKMEEAAVLNVPNDTNLTSKVSY
jgi:hypothetical protein